MKKSIIKHLRWLLILEAFYRIGYILKYPDMNYQDFMPETMSLILFIVTEFCYWYIVVLCNMAFWKRYTWRRVFMEFKWFSLARKNEDYCENAGH